MRSRDLIWDDELRWSLSVIELKLSCKLFFLTSTRTVRNIVSVISFP